MMDVKKTNVVDLRGQIRYSLIFKVEQKSLLDKSACLSGIAKQASYERASITSLASLVI
jgi:hypothetical protein